MYITIGHRVTYVCMVWIYICIYIYIYIYIYTYISSSTHTHVHQDNWNHVVILLTREQRRVYDVACCLSVFTADTHHSQDCGSGSWVAATLVSRCNLQCLPSVMCFSPRNFFSFFASNKKKQLLLDRRRLGSSALAGRDRMVPHGMQAPGGDSPRVMRVSGCDILSSRAHDYGKWSPIERIPEAHFVRVPFLMEKNVFGSN
jgi:hypothetical protein